MKKIILIICSIILLQINLFSYDRITKATINKQISQLTYWSNYIPNKYIHDIINISNIENIPIEYIYAICKVESNYKYLKSLNINVDGSVDHGLMGINSKNIEDIDFLNEFYYKFNTEKFNIHNQKHIITIGTRYFKYLYNQLRDYNKAILAYNCGITRYFKNDIPQNTYAYKDKINYIIKSLKTYNDSNILIITIENSNNMNVNNEFILCINLIELFFNRDDYTVITDSIKHI